ncbi:ATP-dependent Clp protease adaptor protein ClpS [Gracilaria domingensis]|nr:ATP-dependent Clp protease adaptor protein ClpS [Gracilaria domingensis]
MAFLNPVSLRSAAVAYRNSPVVCRRRPRMAALDAPVKEDLRTRFNNLLAKTPSTTPSTESTRVKQRIDPGKYYKVLIFNDEMHSKDFVTKVLLKVIPGLTPDAAWAIMNKAHTHGKAVVGVWIFEISEGGVSEFVIRTALCRINCCLHDLGQAMHSAGPKFEKLSSCHHERRLGTDFWV